MRTFSKGDMAVLPEPGPAAFAGIDTHKDTHMVALVDAVGREVEIRQFPADAEGYKAVAAMIGSTDIPVGVEGTFSYGRGLSDFLVECGYDVFEMIRPKREQRRRGKSDAIDALAAARNLAAGKGVPRKHLTGAAAELRILLVLRDRYVKENIGTMNVIASMLVTAPEGYRDRFRGLAGDKLIAALRASKAKGTLPEAMRSLARRWSQNKKECQELEERMKGIVLDSFPALITAKGVGAISAAKLIVAAGDNPAQLGSDAAFSMLCGTSPIPVSSGRTDRHRLNRGGDRRANSAIHEIAETRIRLGGDSADYVRRKISEGKTRKEAVRCLCRFIAREMFRLMTGPQDVPDPRALEGRRNMLGLARGDVAKVLGVNPPKIRNTEKLVSLDSEFIRLYDETLLLVERQEFEVCSC